MFQAPGPNTYLRAPQNIATSRTSHNLLNAVGDVLRDLIEFPHHDLKVVEAGCMLSLRLAERAGRRGLVVATVRPGLSELLDGNEHLTVTEGQPHPPSSAASCFGKGRLPREAPAAGRVPD